MIIFLDIDGVMVPAKSWQPPALLEDGFAAFSPQSVSTLKALLRKEDTVMLTSSHKSNYSILNWIEIFFKRGLEIKSLTVLPTNQRHLSRKEELLDWFKQNPEPTSFVIIDDDSSLMDLPLYLKQRWVMTQSMIGLTESHLEQLENIRVMLPSTVDFSIDSSLVE